MACNLTRGRTVPCKDNISGIRRVYLFPYTFYRDFEMQRTKGVSLGQFAVTTLVYPFDVRSDGNTFNETLQRGENGLYSFNQNITLQFPKKGTDFQTDMQPLYKRTHRAIVEHNNGTYQIAGIINGLDASIETVSGGTYAEFSGYRVTLTGMEEYSGEFIADLQDAGFEVAPKELGFDYFFDFQLS